MNQLISFGRLDVTDFEPLSIEENGLNLIEGEPNARIHNLVMDDDIWAAVTVFEPCKFSYRTESYGALQLLEGSGTLTIDGEIREVGVGDVALLKPGFELNWDVKTRIKEYFIMFLDSKSKGAQ